MTTCRYKVLEELYGDAITIADADDHDGKHCCDVCEHQHERVDLAAHGMDGRGGSQFG